MKNSIPISVKKECCRLKREGYNSRQIYNNYYVKQVENPCTHNTFRRSLLKWEGKTFPDDTTLECGTYEGFVAHNATVQVSSTGQIVQAWIKQKAIDFDIEDIVEALRENVEPYKYIIPIDENADRMLEVPLFDMHWGISFLEDYKNVLDDILERIQSRHWDRIIIPFGQDYFHNDSLMIGTTSNGTAIEKVDMQRAVKEGRQFITAIIDAALTNANTVRVIYTPGNHDRSVTWMFMQVLLERYGSDIVDDSMEYRKVFTYGKNSIMVTHGDSKQATAKNLAHIFAVSYPEEFAQATVREVHAGHLHHEKTGDIYGVMIRRLSTGVTVDDWSNRQDYIGTHRRFMIFEWDQNALRSIHYV
nr:MAG TPA: metallophosphatase domain protein [Caudoviricetes sp.]